MQPSAPFLSGARSLASSHRVAGGFQCLPQAKLMNSPPRDSFQEFAQEPPSKISSPNVSGMGSNTSKRAHGFCSNRPPSCRYAPRHVSKRHSRRAIPERAMPHVRVCACARLIHKFITLPVSAKRILFSIPAFRDRISGGRKKSSPRNTLGKPASSEKVFRESPQKSRWIARLVRKSIPVRVGTG